MLKSYKVFFFLLKTLRIFVSLYSENILVLYAGLELKMFSIIPLLQATSQRNIIYFVFQVFGSLLMLRALVFKIKTLFSLALMVKIGGLPFFWFPKFLESQLNIFLIFWISSVQKIPLYFLFNEFVDWKIFKGILVISRFCFFSRLGLWKAKSLKNLFAWRSLLHSGLRILLVSLVDNLRFCVLYCLNILSSSLFCFFCLQTFRQKKQNSITFLHLAFSGLPLFVKVLLEFILIVLLNNFVWVMILSLCLVLHTFWFLRFYLRKRGFSGSHLFTPLPPSKFWILFTFPPFVWFLFY